ncbi:MAG: hypothetical protein WCH29_03520 [Chitinophagaceae bacterium]
MMRPVTASIFIMAFVIQMFSGQFIAINYSINTALFAKNCENKARPKMHCNGKCQMMKKMKDQEKREQQNSERKSESKDEVLSSKSYFGTIHIQSVLVRNQYAYEMPDPPVDRSFAFFHPPQA